MNYKIVNINESGNRSVLIVYTGGTFGMVRDESGSLMPFNFGKVVERIPELRSLRIKLTVISFPFPIDSSNINIQDWKSLSYIIEKNYHQYDGFVILHGTDTMAYTASALSFMLDGLNKPVILTGAQMPIGFTRSDARENLITALEIAAATDNDKSIVSEVCIYFNFILLRGNRSQKIRSSTFAAFESENYPHLAEAGISIEYNRSVLKPYDANARLSVKSEFNPNVTILKIFPGISEPVVRGTIFADNLHGVILETFGSGNTMKFDWFLDCLQEAVKNKIIFLNVSQCVGGEVEQGSYETSKKLNEIGVLNGSDLTIEAAVTKMMFLLANEKDSDQVKKKMIIPIKGEMD